MKIRVFLWLWCKHWCAIKVIERSLCIWKHCYQEIDDKCSMCFGAWSINQTIFIYQLIGWMCRQSESIRNQTAQNTSQGTSFRYLTHWYSSNHLFGDPSDQCPVWMPSTARWVPLPLVLHKQMIHLSGEGREVIRPATESPNQWSAELDRFVS